MMTEGGRSIDDRITYGFRLVTARRPSDAELTVLREAYASDMKRYSDDQAAALKLLNVGESTFRTELNVADLAAFAGVARLLLNLDEAITK